MKSYSKHLEECFMAHFGNRDSFRKVCVLPVRCGTRLFWMAVQDSDSQFLFRLLLHCGHANVSFVVPSPVWLSEQPKFHTEWEVGSAVTDVTHDVQVEFNSAEFRAVLWALVNSQDMLSFGSFPSRWKPTDCELAFSYCSSLTSWTEHSSDAAVGGFAEAGGGRAQVPPPCTATRSILSWGDCAWSNLQGERGDE